jgi:sugar phosphate isomerase/epimerase
MTRKISLDQLTVIGVTPPELVDVAAAVGYDLIGPMFGVSKDFPMPVVNLERGHPQTIAMAARLKATGVSIYNMDGFALMPDMGFDTLDARLELTAELGTRYVATLGFDPDPVRAMDSFCRLCERARHYGLGVMLEFYPSSSIPSIDVAVAWLEKAGQANARMMVDALHLNNSGGKPEDILKVAPDLIGAAQVRDGPLHPTEEQIHSLYERGIPGTGELPLVNFIAALPAHVPIGVEVPLKSLADQGVSHTERARLCLEATRQIIARAEAQSKRS